MNTSNTSDASLESWPMRTRAMVLLVDDQAMVAEAIRRMIAEDPELDFHYCPNPDDAIKIASQIRPTVILQDLVMPQVDGLTQVKRFRAHGSTKDTPIVVLSTREDPAVKRDAFTVGANDYLVKIPDKLELIARLRYHSKAFLSQLDREEAYRALRQSQQELVNSNTALVAANQKLEQALSQVKQLQGLVPICCYCKKIRDDQNYWNQIEDYVAKHSDAQFSHGICPECFESRIMPDLQKFKEEIQENPSTWSASDEPPHEKAA